MANEVYGCSLQTVDLGPSGSPAGINDAYDTTKINNGARMPLGVAFYLPDSTGRRLKYRYVRYNPTAAVVLVAATNVPGIVYWKDNAGQVVTPTMSESITTKANSVAGYLLNPNATAGNYVCIQVAGYLKGANVAASTAVDDLQIGSTTTALIPGRIATGASITQKVAAVALTAVSGVLGDVNVCCEDISF